MYDDLHDMLMNNDTIREFFLKLPVRVQMTVHQRNDEIKTAEELHQYVSFLFKR